MQQQWNCTLCSFVQNSIFACRVCMVVHVRVIEASCLHIWLFILAWVLLGHILMRLLVTVRPIFKFPTYYHFLCINAKVLRAWQFTLSSVVACPMIISNMVEFTVCKVLSVIVLIKRTLIIFDYIFTWYSRRLGSTTYCPDENVSQYIC